MATIVGEMAEIFKSSPYIHVGCDETSKPPSLPGYASFATEHNISDGQDLFAYYVKTMADAVKQTGKQVSNPHLILMILTSSSPRPHLIHP